MTAENINLFYLVLKQITKNIQIPFWSVTLKLFDGSLIELEWESSSSWGGGGGGSGWLDGAWGGVPGGGGGFCSGKHGCTSTLCLRFEKEVSKFLKFGASKFAELLKLGFSSMTSFDWSSKSTWAAAASPEESWKDVKERQLESC